MSSSVRCGVVGFGLAGRIFHAAVIDATPGLELAAIVQRSGDAAQKAYPGVPVYASVDAMLAESGIEVAVIATPNQSHAPLAEQCLRAGKHVVVDKPAAVSAQEASALIAASQATERRVFVYHNRRWDGDYLTARQLIQSGTLGQLRVFESHFDRYRPVPKANAWREEPEPGAGILLDLGTHLADQAITLFGLPAAIWADVRVERDGSRVDDTFDVRLYYPALTVWLRSSSLASLPAVRFLLQGTKGSYRKYGLDPQEDALRGGDLFHSDRWGVDPESEWGSITTLDSDGTPRHSTVPTLPGDYRGFYANIRETLRGGATQAVTLLDAWHVLRLLEWARLSSERRSAIPCDWSEAPKI